MVALTHNSGVRPVGLAEADGFVQALGFAHSDRHCLTVCLEDQRARCSDSKSGRRPDLTTATVPDSGKTMASQTPGLSFGTLVEQPSPRTAQPQIRFIPDSGKWLRSANRTAPPGYSATNHVGTAAPGCRAEPGSAISGFDKPGRVALDWTAAGGCPHLVRSPLPAASLQALSDWMPRSPQDPWFLLNGSCVSGNEGAT